MNHLKPGYTLNFNPVKFMRLNRWRVGICVTEHHMTEVQCETEEEALILANKKIHEFPNDYLTASHQYETSIYINDKDSRGFSSYVPDYISNNDDMADFT